VVRGETAPNDDYDVDRLAELFQGELPAPPANARRLEIDGQRLTAMREFVRGAANSYGLRADRVDDLVLAANEIVTNSIRHGGGWCALTTWQDDGAAVCEVRDRGLVHDPLVGRLAPAAGAASGRGLWLANHLCDLLQMRSSPAGTVVRLVVDR
jgi:anti-sigma regulatory factor (Ser/Thr protein kinase)